VARPRTPAPSTTILAIRDLRSYACARAERVRGHVALMSGAVPEAMALLASAATTFERIEAPYDWARATLSRAAACAAAGNDELATRLRADALERAARIGAALPRVG
jgi:hypothetical protein